MSTIVQNLLQSALGDGARSTKWDVAFAFTNPTMFPSAQNVAMMCKTTALPARGMSTIELKYKGRTIPIRGQVKYPQRWECTFYSDSAHKLKNAFETWIEAMDETVHYEEVNQYTSDTITLHGKQGYVKDIAIYQESFDETQNSCRYILHNVFPVEVSPVSLSSEGPGTVEEFTVTFSYSHYEIESLKGESGNFVDSFITKLKNAGAEVVNSIVGSMYSEISNFLNSSGINALADTISMIPNNLLNSASQAFAERFNSVLALGGAGGFTEGKGFSIASSISSLTSGIGSGISSITSLIGSIAGTAAAYIGNMLSGISDAVSGLLSGGLDALSGLSSSVSGALSSITGSSKLDSANTEVSGALDAAEAAKFAKDRAAAQVTT